jgi:uncharacterized membrane protein
MKRHVDAPGADARPRLPAVDVARGVALAAMIIYHFSWDLSFLGFVRVDVATHPAWRAFAMAIAGSFLFLVGCGLVLAHPGRVRWRSFARRLGTVAAAAAVITAATLLIFPDSFIFFGILHMIAVGSLLALPFLRAPPWLTIVAALVVLALPRFIASPVFDPPWLAWTGFYANAPLTNDFEPVFPWLAPVLLGVAAARIVVGSSLIGRLAALRVRSRPARMLAAMGRRSLVIYLVHQPLLLAVLFPLAWWFEPGQGRARDGFVSACISACTANGSEAALCRSACPCAADALERNGLASVMSASRIRPDQRELMARVTRQCFSQNEEGAQQSPRASP